MKPHHFAVTIPLTVAYTLDGEGMARMFKHDHPDDIERVKQGLRAMMGGRLTAEINHSLEAFEKAFDIRWARFVEQLAKENPDDAPDISSQSL